MMLNVGENLRFTLLKLKVEVDLRQQQLLARGQVEQEGGH